MLLFCFCMVSVLSVVSFMLGMKKFIVLLCVCWFFFVIFDEWVCNIVFVFGDW